MKQLSLDAIKTDGGTQMRAELSTDVYLDYRDKIIDGVKFPPLDVFFDGSEYWLADGFHRFYGHREAGVLKIGCTVHNGTKRDAILFAAGANQGHGLRRSNADKRNAVEALLNDPEWVLWSDNKIAETAGVSQPFVGERRAQLITVISSPAAKSKEEPKVGKDGKARKPIKKPEIKTNFGPQVIKAEPPPDQPDDVCGDAEPLLPKESSVLNDAIQTLRAAANEAIKGMTEDQIRMLAIWFGQAAEDISSEGRIA